MPIDPLEAVVLGMTSTRRPTTARTIKAAVTEDQRTDLDDTIARLLDRGALIKTKKHTYLKTEGA